MWGFSLHEIEKTSENVIIILQKLMNLQKRINVDQHCVRTAVR